MIQELPYRNRPLTPFRYKRYFESKNQRIHVFGLCEVTGRNYEIDIPVDGFFTYLQGFKSITDALTNTTPEERDFILTGVSPEGRIQRDGAA